METLVNSQLKEFSVEAYHKDDFKTVTHEDLLGKWSILFFYPADFTFVCPTELHAFQAALGEFEKRNTLVVGASCDSAEVHFAWLNTAKDNGGIEGVTYPYNYITIIGKFSTK